MHGGSSGGDGCALIYENHLSAETAYTRTAGCGVYVPASVADDVAQSGKTSTYTHSTYKPVAMVVWQHRRFVVVLKSLPGFFIGGYRWYCRALRWIGTVLIWHGIMVRRGGAAGLTYNPYQIVLLCRSH